LFIAKIVGFISQIHASKTIVASDAVPAKITVATMFEIKPVKTVKTASAIRDFVTEFAIEKKEKIRTVFVVKRIRAKIAVFIAVCREGKVAVTALGTVTRVVAILVADPIDGKAWYDFLQLRELFKKRTVEIKIATIGFGIPLIAPIQFLVVNRERTVRIVERNERFSGFIALTMVEKIVIAEAQTAALALLGAEGWIWHAKFLKHGLIFVRENERFSGEATFEGDGGHGGRG